MDPDKVKALQIGHRYIDHQRLASACSATLLEASLDCQRAAEADALIWCVPSPLGRYRELDLRFIRRTLEALVPHLHPGQLISLESTAYPGTTEEKWRPRMEASRLRVGVHGCLVYSPKRKDLGNTRFRTATIPKRIGGSTPVCLEVGVALVA